MQTPNATFDIRAQIHDNAALLFPIIEEDICNLAGVPKLVVTVMGTGTTFRAQVLNDFWRGTKGTRWVFIAGKETHSVENALENLLNVTMVMLNKHANKNFVIDAGYESVEAGDGFYYRKKPQNTYTT